MKLAWILAFTVIPCFAQELRMSESLDSLPTLLYPPLMRIARVEGRFRSKLLIHNGQVLSIETESETRPESTLAIEASKRLIQRFKFKDSANGVMHIQFLFRLNPAKVPGSIPAIETSIDWQANIVTFNYSAVTVEINMLN